MQKNIGKAAPLSAYLDTSSEENIERNARFLKMLNDVKIEDIEELEEEQRKLNEHIPFHIKFPKDYLWQIYYSEYTDKYFMLVPVNDLEYTAFFYLLKKKLENVKDETIFVPICYTNYSRKFYRKLEFADIENYIWFFTKEWPLIYEVYDKNGNLSLHITGKCFVYENIESDYDIRITNVDDAKKFYKLIKALFILQSELPHYYKFELRIDENGGIEFYFNKKKMIYEILSSFIKEEYIKAENMLVDNTKEKGILEKELNKLKLDATGYEKQYLEKEKQIATFLECKKTFFGRIKYFFKYKKPNKLENPSKEFENNQDENKAETVPSYEEIKKYYTLEELISLLKKTDLEINQVKNLKLDINAIKIRIENLLRKIENAKKYIEEIEKHQKSIFDFWKFTNKDKIEELPEPGEKGKRIKKVFNYEQDFESFAIQLDKKQRELLSSREVDSIYIASTNLIKDINTVAEGKNIEDGTLEKLKNNILEQKMLLNDESFDIFSGKNWSIGKINTLSDKRHRETPKDLYQVLDITKETRATQYEKILEECIENINNSFKKINAPINFPVYMLNNEGLQGRFNRFNINSQKAIESSKGKKLIKLNIKEGLPIIGYTNIIYYDNLNKTLPLGMDVTEEILIDKNLLNLKLKDTKDINIVKYKEDSKLMETYISTINVEEYDIE